MSNDREEIVMEWLARAEHFWILSRVGEHELTQMFCAIHIHALAVELMIKTAILTLDPAANSWTGFDSRRIFPEGHRVVRLIDRWNKLSPKAKIVMSKDNMLGWNATGDGLILSEHSFRRFEKYEDPEMVGRYFEGRPFEEKNVF